MRWIKKCSQIGTVSEWLGLPKLPSTMQDLGYIAYEGVLPVSRLDIVDSVVVELPEVTPNKYVQWYAANPDLAKRVGEYAALLDNLELSYNATTDEIAAAINSKVDGDNARVAMILQMLTAFDNIVLNLEYLDVPKPQCTAWAEMPYLVANLPLE